LADVIFILIAFFSSYRLIQSIKDDPALFIFGGLVMLTYGIISFVKNKKESKKSIDEIDPKELAKTNYFSLFIKGFFLNFINSLLFRFFWGGMRCPTPVSPDHITSQTHVIMLSLSPVTIHAWGQEGFSVFRVGL
jgi:threonine/homoserine/homoserine lactone efflux protein